MSENIIYITGASSGNGAALAKRYAADGIVLCLLTNSDAQKLGEVADECRRKGAVANTFLADVGDRQAMITIAAEIIEKHGSPDIVIANAGIGPADPDDYFASDTAEKVMSVNFFGVINTLVPFIEPMMARGNGQFVIVSSVSSLRSTPNSGLYSASKAAASKWVEGIHFRLKPFGIHTTTICPGFVDTSMTEANRFVMPGIISADEAARLIINAIVRKRATYYMPMVARVIWRTFYILPDGFYNIVMSLAYKYWPSRS